MSRLRLLLACALFTGCFAPMPRTAGDAVPSPAPASAPSNPQAVTEEAAIASALQLLKRESSDYKIRPTDLLEISVYQQKDLERKVRVGQNGTISFPLIGGVSVGGLSLLEAEEVLATKLKEFLVNPQVTVFISEYGNKRIFVLGEVAKPGSIELPSEAKMTVLEAVSLAGGFTPVAAPDRTKVIRTTAGKSESFTVEVSAITKRGEKNKDITLLPDDVIYVPQSFF